MQFSPENMLCECHRFIFQVLPQFWVNFERLPGVNEGVFVDPKPRIYLATVTPSEFVMKHRISRPK